MEINRNKVINNKLLINNSANCKSNKIGFSGNPLAALGPEKLMEKVPDSFWKKLSDKVPEKVFTSNFSKKMINMAANNVSLFQTSVVLLLATTLRPASIMAMPGANKEDKKYAAAKSIATGVIEFGVIAALFIPIAAATNHLGEMASKGLLKTGFPSKNTKQFEAFKYLSNYGIKFIVTPLKSMAVVALVVPLVHKLFDKPKNKGAV